jgi:hypothetical protein
MLLLLLTNQHDKAAATEGTAQRDRREVREGIAAEEM